MVYCCIAFIGSYLCYCLLFLFKKDLNFEAYKTVIDKTAENSLGRLTLNEIIIDDNQILLNATFKPVKGLNFDYRIFFFPQVL